MTFPRTRNLRWTLAVVLLATSVFLARPEPAAAQADAEVVAEAWRLHAAGRSRTALALLEPRLSEGGSERRLPLIRTALDICLAGGSECVGRLAPQFEAAARTAPATEAGRAMLALEAHFYLEHLRREAGVPAADILATPMWGADIVYGDRILYLRRRVLAAEVMLAAGDRAGAKAAIDRALSLAASLQGAEAAPPTLAPAILDLLWLLMEVDEVRRAHGLLMVGQESLAKALPLGTRDGVRLRLLEADLRQRAGDASGALAAADAAIAGAEGLEGGAELLSIGLETRAAMLLVKGDGAGALAALARAPASDNVLRNFLVYAASVAAGRPEATALQALARAEAQDDHQLSLQAAARVISGEVQAVDELRSRLRTLAVGSGDLGQFARLGVLDGYLAKLALRHPERTQSRDQQEALFAVLQLVARTAAAQDAEALAALSAARTDVQRRTVHQALRLGARRDRLERDGIGRVLAATRPSASSARLTHDTELRARLRDYDLRLAEADKVLAGDGITRGAAPVTELAKVQSALGANEAVLVAAPAEPGRWSYMCLRKSRVVVASREVDAPRFKLDGRLLQAALTAGHAPSEALDSQYPAEAALRLYDVLLRPFESCLQAGNRILWLGGADSTPAPLAALLRQAPAKLGQGYDLARADWAIRTHAISHVGSAALLVAARASPRQGGDLDFLGIGDPVLGGRGFGSERGVRLDVLAPLPETRVELEASARGFRSSRLLLQEAATEAAVRSQMLGAYRYLSFATHGLLREELKGVTEPSLVLTPAAAQGAAEDGLLTASEIADLSLAADFVALSACNTANYDLDVAIEELPALASAFALAGAPSVLGSLWPVDSLASQILVSDVFKQLRAQGMAPADALAGAQQAFLSLPPDKARSHPRFWAAFVVLGDGGAAPRARPPRVRVEAVDTLSVAGGEVIAVDQTAEGPRSLAVGEPDAAGRRGSQIRLPGVDSVRKVQSPFGASPLLLELNGKLIAGGYEAAVDGRLRPVLSQIEAGEATPVWRPEARAADALILASARLPAGEAAFVLGEMDLRNAGLPQRLQVLRLGADLSPKLWFEVAAHDGDALRSAAIAPVGQNLLIAATYESPAEQRLTMDDYDMPVCAGRRTTLLQLRDPAGQLLREQRLSDVAVESALGVGRGVLLGGARRLSCQRDRKAVVLAVSPDLQVEERFVDAGVGSSEIRALSEASGGQLLAAGVKENLVRIEAPKVDVGVDPFGVAPFASTFSGLLVLMDRAGRPAPPELLDSGGNVYVSAATPMDGGVLVGGAIGGQAALVRLRTDARP